jgi:hypothetical protein
MNRVAVKNEMIGRSADSARISSDFPCRSDAPVVSQERAALLPLLAGMPLAGAIKTDRHESAGVLSVKTAAKAARFNAKGGPSTKAQLSRPSGT